MQTNDPQEMLVKLKEEIESLKKTDPVAYLELLKTLNAGITKINGDIDAALGG